MTEDIGGHDVEEFETGIAGFDAVSEGGLPEGRTTLLSGTAGSGKSTFATQFVIEGIQRYGQHGVLIVVEESPEDLAANMKGFGWDMAEMQRQGQLVLIDASADNQAADEPLSVSISNVPGSVTAGSNVVLSVAVNAPTCTMALPSGATVVPAPPSRAGSRWPPSWVST